MFIITKDTLIHSSDYKKDNGQSKQLNLFSSILCLQRCTGCCQPLGNPHLLGINVYSETGWHVVAGTWTYDCKEYCTKNLLIIALVARRMQITTKQS